jgi:ribosomal protein L40E
MDQFCKHCGAKRVKGTKTCIKCFTPWDDVIIQQKQNKATGCLIMFIFAFLFLGVPAIYMFSTNGEGLSESSTNLIGGVVFILLFGVINLVLYNNSKKISFVETKYYHLRPKKKVDGNFCPECGTENDMNSNFCGNCGTKLEGGEQ